MRLGADHERRVLSPRGYAEKPESFSVGMGANVHTGFMNEQDYNGYISSK